MARTAAGFFLDGDLAFDFLPGAFPFDCFVAALLFDFDFFGDFAAFLPAFLAVFLDALFDAFLDFLDLGCFFFGVPAAEISSSLAVFVCNCTASVDRKRQNTKTAMNSIKEQNSNVALNHSIPFYPLPFWQPSFSAHFWQPFLPPCSLAQLACP